jgi:hypothetical protein
MFHSLAWRFTIVLACLLPETCGWASEVDVYLLSGQSNMQGVAKVAELPKNFPAELPHAWFWQGERFETIVPGKTKTSAREGEFGPELGFAWEMAATARPIYLIKYSASGMPLYHGWNGNAWAGNDHAPKRRNFYPGESMQDPNQGTLYLAMLKQFQAGLAVLRAQGDEPTVRSFLWMQGEQDSKHEHSATLYGESLRRLQQRLTDDLKLKSTLPVVFGQVLPHEPALERFTHRKQLREAMAAADADSGKPGALPLVKMVSTNGFGLLPDTVHYNAPGQLQLGQAMAQTLQKLQPKK